MLGEVRHVVEQGPVVAALGRTVLTAARQRLGRGPKGPVEVPGPEHQALVGPRPPALVRDYVRWAGGDPAWYDGRVPAHLFPQWGFPLLGRTLEGLPYPMARVLNVGCRLELGVPLPQGEPMQLSARLDGVDDDGRRAILHERLVTRTAAGQVALTAQVRAFVPLRAGRGSGDKPVVPDDARELARWALPAHAGFEYACLTGDFNPVHWLWPYARLAGFRGTILHGFATLARTVEGLNAALFHGDPEALGRIDVRFGRPLTLPREVGLFVREDMVFVADARGRRPYLLGTFERRNREG